MPIYNSKTNKGSLTNVNSRHLFDSLKDYINGCIYGVKVADRIHITLIGYGNKAPYVIKKGWASEWVDTLIDAKRNSSPIIK